MKENIKTTIKKELDWVTMAIPFLIILLLCISFIFLPDSSKHIIESIRTFLGEELGTYYLAVGLGAFILSLFLAFSRYGKIRLGKGSEKPQYSNFAWGSMMFTSGLAADILFYSLCEWILYAQDPHMAEMGSIQQWSGTYPLFHWGPIPWSFYLILAVSFGFMLHVRGCHKQKFSEACRPLLGSRTDKAPGKIIDLIAVFALLAGTATTFSLATPLMSQIAAELLGIDNSKWITILILVITCIVYTFCVVRGMHGIMKLAASCVYLFFGLLAYVLIFGGETRYIIETGFSSIGNLIQNFVSLSTFTDPQRTTSFPQNWTIFYWAYWMVWCVAAPFKWCGDTPYHPVRPVENSPVLREGGGSLRIGKGGKTHKILNQVSDGGEACLYNISCLASEYQYIGQQSEEQVYTGSGQLHDAVHASDYAEGVNNAGNNQD